MANTNTQIIYIYIHVVRKDVLNNATVEEMNLHIVPKSFVLKVWPAKGKP